ncbi:MAG: hypothetical protein AB7S65_12155 [Sulfuricurvum sp.]
MENTSPYAYLKTNEGEDVNEYSKEKFEVVLMNLKTKMLTQGDKTVYVIEENTKINGIQVYKDDYFEVYTSRA